MRRSPCRFVSGTCAAFQAVALVLEESAFLDGASPWVTFWRITLPLALPAIAVAGLIAFLIGYSEFGRAGSSWTKRKT
ncbi:MAG: ABC transporter permease subunit [Anaerolineae bacterium]|nr:ABC transporter permease subunit [Anaerolineae bacterium]